LGEKKGPGSKLIAQTTSVSSRRQLGRKNTSLNHTGGREEKKEETAVDDMQELIN